MCSKTNFLAKKEVFKDINMTKLAQRKLKVSRLYDTFTVCERVDDQEDFIQYVLYFIFPFKFVFLFFFVII